jgi:hypothetical protein
VTYIATIADNAKAMPTPNIACDATDTTSKRFKKEAQYYLNAKITLLLNNTES